MNLNIRQRFAVVGIYISLILAIGFYLSSSWEFIIDTNNKLNIVLIVTGLALVLSSYITEPYFSKPIDVITRWVAIFLFLIGLDSKNCLSMQKIWIVASILFIIISLLIIILQGNEKIEKQLRISTDIICKISRPEIIFTILYFDIVVSLFSYREKDYPILIGFGFLLAINKPIIWIVSFLSKIISNVNAKNLKGAFIGQVIGFSSTDIFEVEILDANEHRANFFVGKLVYLEKNALGIVGIVLNERTLLGKKWIVVSSLRRDNDDLIIFNRETLLPLTGEKSIFSRSNAVHLIKENELSFEVQQIVADNIINKNFDNFVESVWEGSTIEKIRFNKLFSKKLFLEREIGEGSIIQANIGSQNVLYQIIDARTIEENLQHKDTHGFTIGTAQKLGKYDSESSEIVPVKWLPEIFTPIFLLNPIEIEYNPKDFIGRLPNTNYGIKIKNPAELVTHNTAILGILGIGKSCLTFELIQKLIENTDVKLFCLDLTFQYAKELPFYIQENLIQDDLDDEVKKELKDSIKIGTENNGETWGNVKEYNEILDREFKKFIDSDKRVLILNPDWHAVEKANEGFKKSHNEALTATQKTRIISERIFVQARSKGETQDARYLIVFEEAHSLVPEWNSASNEGDSSATNGTAKVILQGRKYGLGSFVIAQRTANISKSILNQCNTIFALRVFDDTGKQFLENYIGSDYSNLLPTLEERHCVAIGKAVKLKQPIILQLNNANEIKIQMEE